MAKVEASVSGKPRREDEALATRKRDQDGTLGGRPAIKSSHEKVKVTRDPKRAGAEARPRARSARPGLPGVRPLAAPSRAEAPGPFARERARAPRKARRPEEERRG